MLDTAVIPCGGLGTRLHPITRWLPKEMLPVALRPVLHWTLDEAADAGLLRAIIVTNPHKPMLEAVARSYPGPLDLEFVPAGSSPRPGRCAPPGARSPRAVRRSSTLLPDNLFQGPNPTSGGARHSSRHRTGHRAAGRDLARRTRPTKGATGRASHIARASGRHAPGHRRRRQGDRVASIAGGGLGAVTPIGRMAFPGDILEEFEAVSRALPAGAELDDVPVMQRLAGGARSRA